MDQSEPRLRLASLGRAELEAYARRSGLLLDARQLDEFAAAAPHIAALVAAVPRGGAWGDEPAFAAQPGQLPRPTR
jgi:hypothetical protein